MTLLQAHITQDRALIVTDSACYSGAYSEAVAYYWPSGEPVAVPKQHAVPHLNAVLVGVGSLWEITAAADSLHMARDLRDAAETLQRVMRSHRGKWTQDTELFLIGWQEDKGAIGFVHLSKARNWVATIHTARDGVCKLEHPKADPGTPQPHCMETAEAHARATISQQRARDPHSPFGGRLLVSELTRDGLRMRLAGTAGMPAPRDCGVHVMNPGAVAAYMGQAGAGLHCLVLRPGGVDVSWSPCLELDYAETEVRVGSSWAAGTTLHKGPADRFSWWWPALGSYQLWAKHRDSTGNESAAAVLVSVTVDSRINVTQLGETGDAGGVTFSAANGVAKASTAFTTYGGESLIITAAVDTKVPLSTSGSRYVEGAFSIRVDGVDIVSQPFAVEVLPGGAIDALKTVFLNKTVGGLAAGAHTADLFWTLGSLAGANASDNLKNFIVTVATLRA
jgi:hypothetical protein